MKKNYYILLSKAGISQKHILHYMSLKRFFSQLPILLKKGPYKVHVFKYYSNQWAVFHFIPENGYRNFLLRVFKTQNDLINFCDENNILINQADLNF